MGAGEVLLGLLKSENSGSRRCDVKVEGEGSFPGMMGLGCEIGVSSRVENGHGS